MKGKFLPLIAGAILCAALSCTSVCAFADQTIGDADLVVTGSASLEADADFCTFSGSIHTVADEKPDAARKCEEIAAEVSKVFSEYGTATQCRFEVSPMYGQTGFAADACFSFETDRTDSIPAIREKLLQTGLTYIDGPVYSCKEDAQYRAQALQMAIADAKAKAEALGAAGTLVMVEETCCYPCCYGAGGITENRVTYTACVRAVFRTQKQHPDNHPAEESAPSL